MSQTAPIAGYNNQGKYAWYRELTRYHWFVLIVASMGWMFDTMAQQLFNLARKPALTELLGGRRRARSWMSRPVSPRQSS